MANHRDISQQLPAYIPRTICNWYADKCSAEVHTCSRHEGLLICVDASGFTALTRRLAERGKAGPEVLTSILNQFFDSMSQVVEQYGGDLLKFAGDALWVYFPAATDVATLGDALQQELAGINENESELQGAPLRIHIGADIGFFDLMSLGDLELRLEAEPVGDLVSRVYKACDIARDNELVLGSSLANQLDVPTEVSSTDPDFHVYILQDVPIGKNFEGARIEEKTQNRYPDVLKKYVAADVLFRLNTNSTGESLQSEHRQVVVVFACFDIGQDADSEDAFPIFKAKISTAFEQIRNLGGTIARIDPFQGGHKLLALFGTPTKGENDEVHAVRCAADLVALTDSSFRIRAGIAAGPLFCGDVGAAHRREYTVMGEGINTAARLMAKAEWSAVLLDEQLRARLPEQIVTEPATYSLKGIGSKVAGHRLVRFQDTESKNEDYTDIIGQESVWRQLMNCWRNTESGEMQCLILNGDAGVGKSTLVRRLIRTTDGGIVSCRNAVLFGHGWTARNLLKKLQSIASAHPESLGSIAEQALEERWLPLLADVLQTKAADNAWTRDLIGELRHRKASELYVELARTVCERPCVLVIDDFDCADERSRSLISAMGDSKAQLPILLVLVTRGTDGNGSFPEDSATVGLESPSTEEWWRYFDRTFEPGKREKELFERILAVSEGNPQFVRVFLQGCKADGNLKPNRVSGLWELSSSGQAIQIPENLTNLHMAAFDALPEEHRRLLKAAAVAYGPVDTELLSCVVSDGQNVIERHLCSLTEAGLLRPTDGDTTFEFSHSLLRDAIYQCIPQSNLREMHRALGEYTESAAKDDTSRLAYHFYRAHLWQKGFEYSLKEAESSFRANSLSEAGHLFGQCSEILDRQDVHIPEELVFRLSDSYTNFLIFEGRYPDAYRVLRDWRRTGSTDEDHREYLMAAARTAELLWKQAKYEPCRKFLQVVLDNQHSSQIPEVSTKARAIMAEVERRSGRFAQAQKWASEAVAAAERAHRDLDLADASNKLGLAFWGEGKLNKAAECYERSLQVASDSVLVQARSANNLGIIRWEQGDFVKAERLLSQAQEVFQNIGDRRNEAYSLGNLANLNKLFGRLSLATEQFQRADLIFESLDDRHAHFYTVGNLGEVDLILGDLRSCRQRFGDTLEFARSVGDDELEAESEIRRGELAFFSNRCDDADKHYRSAIKKAKQIGSSEYLLRASIGLGRLLIGRRRKTEALRTIRKITEEAKKEGAILAEKEAEFLIGEYHRICDNRVEAEASFQQVLDYAKGQQLFELTIKSACRLIDLGADSRCGASDDLEQIAVTYEDVNGCGSWDKLIDSAYFSFFAQTLRTVSLLRTSGLPHTV